MHSVASDREVGRTAAANDPLAHGLEFYLRPLLSLLTDGVTEVCVNAPGVAWTESVDGWRSHAMPEALGLAQCQRLAKAIGNFNGKPINEMTPYLSGTLPGMERVQVVIPPACTPGTVSITIRKPSMVDKSLEELEAEGSFAEVADATGALSEVDAQLLALKGERRMTEFLDLAVRSRKNILLAGATGSGKTTVMKTLARSIPHAERVITIEDTHEMFLREVPNKVHLFYSTPVPGVAGPQYTAQDALKSCLRMKPDRIVLAELRGAEVWDYMESLNTGHPGSLSSIHASNATDTFSRLVLLIKATPAGMNLDPVYLHKMCIETIDVVLYYKQRRLRELYFDPHRRIASSRLSQPEAL